MVIVHMTVRDLHHPELGNNERNLCWTCGSDMTTTGCPRQCYDDSPFLDLNLKPMTREQRFNWLEEFTR